jgi:hypothetical protein
MKVILVHNHRGVFNKTPRIEIIFKNKKDDNLLKIKVL